MKVRICRVCGRLYYNEEIECLKDTNETTPIKDMEVTCRHNTFEIKGDY